MFSSEQAYPAQRFVEHGEIARLAPELYDFGLLMVALVILIAALLPRFFSYRQSLTPLLYAVLGALCFLAPGAPALPDLVEHAWMPMRLTELGVPCPNLFTGMQNVHGPLEWISVQDMALATDLCLSLVRRAATPTG